MTCCCSVLSLGVRFIGDFQASYLLARSDRVAGFRSVDGREVQAKHTVVADGAHSQFCVDRGRRRLIQAIMGWWEGVTFEPHHIEMIFDRMVNPLYGWMFPEGPGRVNIGICYEDPHLEKNSRQLFTQFLDKHYRDHLRGAHQSAAGRAIRSPMRRRSEPSPHRAASSSARRAA